MGATFCYTKFRDSELATPSVSFEGFTRWMLDGDGYVLEQRMVNLVGGNARVFGTVNKWLPRQVPVVVRRFFGFEKAGQP